ncbi:MAG: hypothetical protein OQK95_14530 [Gammaproteobacteria bacterium]|nr:hypothetical protein [Gammaproteobacteria bacterium]
MLRKLAVFIISAGLTMSPLSVQALGFGGIKLKSSLNEKLNAEVALLSASANDIESLTINLATEEAFLRSGIDRTALLNKLKFKVKQNDRGDYYIHVTTTETVREPFMNFLLEMNWKNGRMLREYTMLIDPPGRAPKQFAEPAPVVAEMTAPEMEVEAEIETAPVVEEAPMVMMEDEPVAAVEDSTPFIEPIIEDAPLPEIDAESAVAVEDSAPAVDMAVPEPVAEFEPEPIAEIEPVIEIEPEIEMAEPAIAVAPEMETEAEPMGDEQVFDSDAVWPRIPLAAFDQSDEGVEVEEVVETPVTPAGDLDYGITKANDNLWNIAEKLRNGDESVSVHQVMMALLQSNPDAFVKNNVHRLKVGHVLRIDDPSALTSMSRKEASTAYVQQTQEWNNYRQQVAGTTTVQPIMAGDSSADMEAAATDTTGELTLAAPDGESLTTGGGANEETLSDDLATMQDQLRQAKADAGTMRTRNVALNDKLQSLEDELNRLQRSLSVKDDELAALQKQLSDLNQQPVQAPAVEEVAEPVVAEEPAQPEVVEPVVAEEPAKVEEPTEPEVTAPVVTEAPAEPEQPATEPGIMDTVMAVIASIGASIAGIAAGLDLGGDSLLFIAVPIVLVLLIIILIVVKRRRAGDNFQESILTGAASASAAEAGGVASADSSTFSEESSFLSDFAMSGASAIEADDSEVDPLTEADVFMAYGRYEAAEERLNEAIQNEPNRMELRAKLLELYHATQNKAAFESSAEDFYASLGGNEADSPLWSKVVSMGSEIAPGNPLFNTGGAAADIFATAESPAFDDPGMAMTDSQVMDIGLETGVFAAADLSGLPDTPADDLDFNLDLGESSENDDMDFNLDIGGGTDAAADMDFNLDMGMTESSDKDAGLDFNLDMGTNEVVAESPAGDLDFNLDMGTTETADAGGLDFDLDMGGTESADLSLDFDTGSSDEGSLDLNLDASDTADEDIGGGDEVGTKLDLAKAYIDMGDPEGARSILDEVMDEGSSTQKEEAQSLLGQIA